MQIKASFYLSNFGALYCSGSKFFPLWCFGFGCRVKAVNENGNILRLMAGHKNNFNFLKKTLLNRNQGEVITNS